jgi:sortase A
MLQKDKKARYLNYLGNILILLSLLFLVFTFGPVAKEEVEYQARNTLNLPLKEIDLTPPNTDFSIVIPKIGAVAPVVANVDPFDEPTYLAALRRGVAHAKGTSYPGEFGNTYIFAHSTDTFYNVGRYNAVFYLIGKLEKGDEIDIYYKGEKIVYEVTDKKGPEAVKYLGKLGDWNTLTLQTCYPPGTTLKRLVVIANQKS